MARSQPSAANPRRGAILPDQMSSEAALSANKFFGGISDPGADNIAIPMPDPRPAAPGIPAPDVLMRQTRQNAAILGATAAGIAILIVANLGGFCRNLLLEAIPHQLLFALFLLLLFSFIIKPVQTGRSATASRIFIPLLISILGITRLAGLQIFIVLAILGALLPRAFLNRDGDCARLSFIISASLMLTVAPTLALVGQQLTIYYHQMTYDVPAYVTDRAYGGVASVVLGEFLWAHPLAHRSLGLIYSLLTASVSVCYGLNVQAGNRDAAVLRNTALAAGAFAFILYNIYPAAGPIYAFGSAFPAHMPDPAALSLAPTGLAVAAAPRNCMPSVHFAWALLAVVEARRLARGWQVGFGLFAVATAIATIALGEHYLIDLVVAVPFTLGVHAICSRRAGSVLDWRFTATLGAATTL
ncbi:MAG: phosphatase PAP2 family protein, partial [Alphaproteobacteria bacterium]|nr:phosphatase PAP2 family protein [Alphaproteobacteria bacterium]